MANTNLSEERTKQLKEAKQELDNLSGIISDILDGKLSQSAAARKLGVAPGYMPRMAKSQFLSKLHKIKGLSTETLKDALLQTVTPYEMLFYCIFGINPKFHGFVLLEEDAENKLKQMVESQLDDKQKQILEKRFGLLGGCCLSYAEVASEYGLTKQQVRNTELYAIRKLRNPSAWQALLPDYDDCFTKLEELSEFRRANEKLLACYKEAQEECRELEEENRLLEKETLTEKEQARLKQIQQEKALRIPLASLGLSTRLRNVLRRNGFYTVGDVMSGTRDELSHLSGMGAATIQELEQAFGNLGLSFVEEKQEKPTLTIVERENGWHAGYVEKDGELKQIFNTGVLFPFKAMQHYTERGYTVKCLGKEDEKEFLSGRKVKHPIDECLWNRPHYWSNWP